MSMETLLIRMMAVTFTLIRMLKTMRSMCVDSSFSSPCLSLSLSLSMVIDSNICLPDQSGNMFFTWQGIRSTGQLWPCSTMVKHHFIFCLIECIQWFWWMTMQLFWSLSSLTPFTQYLHWECWVIRYSLEDIKKMSFSCKTRTHC